LLLMRALLNRYALYGGEGRNLQESSPKKQKGAPVVRPIVNQLTQLKALR
jgi:hypothetical protein